MGRPPLGKRAMTDAERQQRRRAKFRDRETVTKPRATAPDEAAELRTKLARAEQRIADFEAAAAASSAQHGGGVLSKTGQKQLEIAKRKLDAEHAARMQNLDEEVRQRVLKEGKEYRGRLEKVEADVWEKEKWYRKLINDHKPPFTRDQYRLIRMCVHPDGERTPAKLHEASILLDDKQEVLTGERKKKRIV